MSERQIKNVAIVGAGQMGNGIGGRICPLGLPTLPCKTYMIKPYSGQWRVLKNTWI